MRHEPAVGLVFDDVEVQDSAALPGPAIATGTSIDLGNNTNWIFPTKTTAWTNGNGTSAWEDAGSQSLYEQAHARVAEMLADYYPTYIDPAVDRKIRDRFPIRLQPEDMKPGNGRW